MSEDPKNLIDFQDGAAAVKGKRKSAKTDTEKDPLPTASQIAECIEEMIFHNPDERDNWTLNRVTGIYSSPRAQQDGKLTIASAAEKIHFLRQGLPMPLSGDQIRGALTEIVSDQRALLWLKMKARHGVKALPEKIAAGPDNYFLIEFLKCLADRSVKENEALFELKVVEHRHFIRNMKRRLMGLPDSNQILLDWHGKGGSGKSSLAMAWLTTAWEDLGQPITLNAYDPLGFNKDSLWQLLMGLADEANGEDSVKTADLKNGITSKVVLGRNMYSPQSPCPDRNLSLIICRNGLGAWQKLLGDRRVASLLCTDTHGSLNSDNLNYARELITPMMDSVYYNEPEYYADHIKQFEEYRMTIASDESFAAMWLSICCKPSTNGDFNSYMEVRASMHKFAKTCGDNPKKVVPRSKADMSAELKLVGADMPSTGNTYPLTSHCIKPEWAL